MLLATAIAAGILPPRNGRRRAVNKQRYGCTSTEELCLSARVSVQEVRQLAIEFRQWRRRRGVTTGLVYAERRVKLFLVYLARGGYYHQCGRSEGLSLTAAAVYLHQVAAFFAETAGQYVLKFAFNVLPRFIGWPVSCTIGWSKKSASTGRCKLHSTRSNAMQILS